MNETEFKQLYESHAKSLWSYIRRFCNDEDLTNDVVQESFVRMLSREIPSLTDQQRKTYLFQTATRLVLDHWRANKKMTELSIEDKMEQNFELKVVQKIDLESAFRQLPSNQRSLLWLAYAENYSHSEIAEILNIQSKSVKVLLFRAKNRLLEILSKKESL
ncbi:RNA polymerase sigma factor [bacterium]|nr:RNA polymerase sigma factor [bacterium]